MKSDALAVDRDERPQVAVQTALTGAADALLGRGEHEDVQHVGAAGERTLRAAADDDALAEGRRLLDDAAGTPGEALRVHHLRVVR